MTDLMIQNGFNYEMALDKAGCSDKTRETYANALKSYVDFCAHNNVNENLDSLKAWIESAKTPSTQTVYVSAVKKAFSVLFRDDPRLAQLKLELDSIKKTKRDLKIKESKYLTKDEYNKIVENSSERVGLVITTLFVTGLRVSELLNIKLSDCIAIKEGKIYEISVVGKGRKPNTVFINTGLFKSLRTMFNGETYLFEHDGKQYDRSYITQRIKAEGKKINKNISAHSLRHSRAMDLMERGVSIDKVSKFLNHSSVATTANSYLHAKPSLEELQITEED